MQNKIFMSTNPQNKDLSLSDYKTLPWVEFKELLKEIREKSDGVTWQCEIVSSSSPDEEKKKAEHLKNMVDMGLLEGEIKRYPFLDGGGLMKVIYYGPTKEGYLFLKNIENSNFLNQIKESIFNIGKEEVKDLAKKTFHICFIFFITYIVNVLINNLL